MRPSYSLDGEPTLVTQPDGTAIELTYDTAGRISAISAPSGATTFTYFTANGPSKGKLASVTTADGVEQAYSYAGALLTDVAWTGPVTGTLHYGYDGQFRVSSESIAGSSAITRSWNLDGQLTLAGGMVLAYDGITGMFQGTTLGVVQDSLTWNDFGEVATYSASAAPSGGVSSPLLSFTFERDVAGRLTGVTESVLGDPSSNNQYSYDTAGRLTDVWQGGALVAHYAYDAHGNRTTTEYAGQPAITATFDNQDRIVTYGSVSFTHAITGERLTRTAAGQTTTYSYDTFGQLQAVTLPDGTPVEYDYDSAGRRVAKKVDGVYEQRFLFGDAFGPVALVDAAGAVLDRYVYGTSPYVPDYLVRTSGPDAGTYRLVKDERGSVRMVVHTATGAVAQQLTYDAFGRVLTDTAPGFTPFGYAGGLLDLDTGLVRFGARDYDPETGRWTTQDPIGLGGGDTNLYGYVVNDPVNYVDPAGKNPVVVGIVAAVGVMIGMGMSAPSDTAGAPADVLGMSLAAMGLRGMPYGSVGGAGVESAAATSVWDGSAGAAAAKVLQTGGNKIRPATARALNEALGQNLTAREWGRALEALKTSAGLPNNYHGQIWSSGWYADPSTGEALGCLLDFIP